MEMSFVALQYQLRMKKRRAEDALQNWILDGDGSIRPETHPDMLVAVGEAEDGDERRKKRFAQVVEKRKGGKKAADAQAFDLIILMKEKKVNVYEKGTISPSHW